MDETNDAELAYVIAHEIAHSSAGHIHEKLALNWFKDKTGNKPPDNFSKSLTNSTEQEADKIAVISPSLDMIPAQAQRSGRSVRPLMICVGQNTSSKSTACRHQPTMVCYRKTVLGSWSGESKCRKITEM